MFDTEGSITDIFISIFHALFVPIFYIGHYGYIVLGCTTVVGEGFLRSIAVDVYAITFFLPFALLVLHFIYRLLSLSRPALVTNRFPVFVMASSVYLAMVTISVTVIVYLLSQNTLPVLYRPRLEEYGFIRANRTVNAATVQYFDDQMRPDVLSIGAASFAGLIGCHTIVISLACIKKIHDAFHAGVLEIRVKRLHVQLFRALMLQFSIPTVFSLLPYSFVAALPLTGIDFGQAGIVCALVASLFPAVDPILMIASISRFRTTLSDWVNAITGGKAERNERMALERSRVYSAIKRRSAIMNY